MSDLVQRFQLRVAPIGAILCGLVLVVVGLARGDTRPALIGVGLIVVVVVLGLMAKHAGRLGTSAIGNGSRSGGLIFGALMTLVGVLLLIFGNDTGSTRNGTPSGVANWVIVGCGLFVMIASRTSSRK